MPDGLTPKCAKRKPTDAVLKFSIRWAKNRWSKPDNRSEDWLSADLCHQRADFSRLPCPGWRNQQRSWVQDLAGSGIAAFDNHVLDDTPTSAAKPRRFLVFR